MLRLTPQETQEIICFIESDKPLLDKCSSGTMVAVAEKLGRSVFYSQDSVAVFEGASRTRAAK
jgi:hypothetical protein